MLSVPPLVLLAVRGLHDDQPLPLALLVGLAAHGFVLVLVAGSPFERIARLGHDA